MMATGSTADGVNGHLAGDTGGLQLARRAAPSYRGPNWREARAFAADVAADRTALRSMMVPLGLPVRRYKGYAAWVAEKAAG